MEDTMDYESGEIRIQNWIDQYGDALFKVCIVYLMDYGLAEDAVQDTFLNAWRFMDRFEGRNGCSEKTWLTSIAINVCRSYRRTKWFQMIDTSTPVNERSLKEKGVPYEELEMLMDVVQLPERYKAVILLYYYQEMSQQEIAEALHISRSMVSHRLRKGLSLLKSSWREKDL